MTHDRVKDALNAAVAKAAAAANAPAGQKPKRKQGGDLRKSLAISIMEIPPALIDHVLRTNKFDPTLKPEDILNDETLLDRLHKSTL